MKAENKEYIKISLKAISELCDAVSRVVHHSEETPEHILETEGILLKAIDAIHSHTYDISTRIE